MRYFIHNGSAVDTVRDVHAGIFMDLDIGSAVDDLDGHRHVPGRRIRPRRQHVVWGATPSSGGSRRGRRNVSIIENPLYVHPEAHVPDEHKIGFLKASGPEYVVTEADSAGDFSIIVSAGPFTILSGDSVEVAFAILGGQSLEEFETHADAALSTYLGLPVAVPGSGVDPGGPLRDLRVVPNPFRASASIRYELVASQRVSISIFDVAGRLVRRLEPGNQPAGVHAAVWDGGDRSGSPVAPGVYFLRILAGSETLDRRIVKIRR